MTSKARRTRSSPVRDGQGPAARILDAARTLLFAHGMDGLTTDGLARQAQVSKSSLYKHFPDLSSLLEAVIAGEAARISHGLPPEPQRDAEMLLSLWEGFAFRRARLGLTDLPFPDPAGWAATCVDRLFPADVW